MRAIFILFFCSLSSKVGLNIAAVGFGPNETLLKIVEDLEDIKEQMKVNELVLKSLLACCEGRTNHIMTSWSLDDIVNAIRIYKFSAAEQQIAELADNSKVHQIIKLVYLDSSVNMDIIIAFAKHLTNTETKFEVFNALHQEMCKDSDPIKFIALVEAMEGELAKEGTVRQDIKTKARSVIDSTIEGIKDAFLNASRTALLNENSWKDGNIEILATAILNFRPKVFRGAIAETVNSAFDDGIKVEKILKHVNNYQNIEHVILDLDTIFRKLKSMTDVYNKSALDFASHLRDLQRREDYKSTRQDLKDKVNGIIEQLPTCAKSIYFYPSVCFWSKSRKEYMYGATAANSYDTERRSIYTWYSGNILPGAVWHVDKIGGYYFFKSANYANEYLYSVNGGAYSKDMRYVFSWMPGNNTDVQSRWVIELDGDHCYIKSAYNNEYMFASGVKFNELNSYVFTRIGLREARSAEYQWQLRNCDLGDIRWV